MHLRTQATLDQLRQVTWFRSVGIRDTENALVVSSWYEAVEHCNAPEWEDLCLEAANQYCERLVERSPDRFQKWNDIVDEVKPVTQALVREKCGEIIRENDLPKSFLDTVDWDILHLCMEGEFADIFPPGFYASQAYWYRSGHFPCGWRGEFPNGTRIVY
jgi:hypothetical protein